jgi:hypothetical protein
MKYNLIILDFYKYLKNFNFDLQKFLKIFKKIFYKIFKKDFMKI